MDEEREKGLGGRVETGDPRFMETLGVWFPLVTLSSLAMEQRTLMDPELGSRVREMDLKDHEVLIRKGKM